MLNTAPAILAPNEGQELIVLGDRIVCKAVGLNTQGAWSLFEVTTAAGSEVPPHFHPDAQEAYYMLEGLLEITINGETVMAEAGSFIRIDKGTTHGYANRTHLPAKFLAWVSPAGIEHFFADMDQTLKTTQPDLEVISKVAARHNVQLAC